MMGPARWLADHAAAVAASGPPAVGTWWVLRDGRGWVLVGGVVALAGLGGLVLHLLPGVRAHLRDWWASVRRERWYRGRWERAMQWAGMADAGAPELVAHRFGGVHLERDMDVLTVRMPAGVQLELWREQATQVAAALGLRWVHVVPVPDQDRVVQVYGSRFLQPATARHGGSVTRAAGMAPAPVGTE